MIFGSVAEVRHALDAGVVSLHAKVKGRFTTSTTTAIRRSRCSTRRPAA